MGYRAANKKLIFLRSLNLLSRQNRKKISLILTTQIVLAILDIIGIFSLGAVSALVIQTVEHLPPGNTVSSVLKFLHIQNYSYHFQIVAISTFAGMLLLGKTILSIRFTRRNFAFLSQACADFSNKLLSKFLAQDFLEIQKYPTQETLYVVTSGVSDLFLGIIGSFINVIADAALLLVIMSGLFILDPVTCLVTMLIFGFIGILTFRQLHAKAKTLGSEIRDYSIRIDSKIIETLRTQRETKVRNRQFYYIDEINKMQQSIAKYTAEKSFLPYISKYIIESVTILSILVLSGFVMFSHNAVHGLSILTVFLAASARIAAAALRLQQNMLTIRSAQGSAEFTIQFSEKLSNVPIGEFRENSLLFEYENFVPQVIIQDLSFQFRNQRGFSINKFSLTIESGETVAIVGPSGSGKSTLVDLILGIINPDTGTVKISGMAPRQVAKKWPGVIGYVPQDVVLIDGTIEENVTLGYPSKLFQVKQVFTALDLAELGELVKGYPKGLKTQVGENGSQFSGGQRQRIGIARALFTNPKVLVFDEATSSLDAQTEAAITSTIARLHGDATILIIAHRLSSILKADKVIYIDNGSIISMGTFDEVRNAVPDFEKQATIIGFQTK